MSPEEYAELSPRIVGRNATQREIDAAWHVLGRYPVGLVVKFLSNSRALSVQQLAEACSRQTLALAAREREPQRCEHGHEDRPFDRCPACAVGRRNSAKAGADLCRASMAEAKR